jgi:osmotically-inducible protein OsmY
MKTETFFPLRSHLTKILVAGVLFVLPLSVTGCQDGELSDPEIAEAIERELIYDPVVLASDIYAQVEDGIVNLRGTTSNLMARDRTERIAETVKGVRSVVNEIDVEPDEARSDEEIGNGVEEALYRDPATDSYEISVNVHDGEVELTGTVESWAERDLSSAVAKGVKGVTGVDNRITVEPADVRNDLEIQREVERTLRWDVLVDHALIRVSVEGGTVFLRGAVGSAAEKRRARRDAFVTGAQIVDDSQLLVQRWARDEEFRQDKYAGVSDEDIEKALRDAAERAPRLYEGDLTVTVQDGAATLEGSVPTLKGLRTATDVAHSTVGVDQVVNRLIVEPVEPPSDEEIVEDVRSSLEESPLVSADDAQVSVLRGVATLTGSVETSFQRAYAEDIASKSRGVIEVQNDLAVEDDTAPLLYDPFVWRFDPRGFYGYMAESYSTEASDEVIRESVQQELFWSPFVDESDIVVTVEDGVVSLTGTVNTLREQADAIENAYEGGAIWVEEELVVTTLGGTPDG